LNWSASLELVASFQKEPRILFHRIRLEVVWTPTTLRLRHNVNLVLFHASDSIANSGKEPFSISSTADSVKESGFIRFPPSITSIVGFDWAARYCTFTFPPGSLTSCSTRSNRRRCAKELIREQHFFHKQPISSSWCSHFLASRSIMLRSWRGQRCGDGEPLPLGAKAETSEWGRPTNRPPFPTNKGKGEEFYQTTAYRKEERRAACAEGQTRGNERRLLLRLRRR